MLVSSNITVSNRIVVNEIKDVTVRLSISCIDCDVIYI